MTDCSIGLSNSPFPNTSLYDRIFCTAIGLVVSLYLSFGQYGGFETELNSECPKATAGISSALLPLGSRSPDVCPLLLSSRYGGVSGGVRHNLNPEIIDRATEPYESKVLSIIDSDFVARESFVKAISQSGSTWASWTILLAHCFCNTGVPKALSKSYVRG